MKTDFNKNVIQAQFEIVNQVTSAWKSQVLFVLTKMGVFDYLENNSATTKEISSQFSIPEESLEKLLDCGVSIGYLDKNNLYYSNSNLSSNVLVKEKPGYMGNWLLLADRWYHSFGNLEQGIRTNSAVVEMNYDPSGCEIFVKGMIDYASYRGQDILNYLDLNDKKRMLDIGCGPGIYSVMFCEKYKNLHVTGIDLPHAITIAEKYVIHKNLTDRIDLKPLNYNEIESLGEGYDVIFLSHVLHQENRDRCKQLVEKCFHALVPNGLLIVQAMFIDKNDISSTYAHLHNLLSLLIFPGGKNYSIEDTINLLKEVGLKNVQHQKMSFFNINSFVSGIKG